MYPFPLFLPSWANHKHAWELERDDLKGVAKFTKKGELHGRIDRKNEEIDILKIGLSGIAKRYGYGNVQEFYKIYHKSTVHIQLIRNKRLNKRKFMERTAKSRIRKAYLNS